MSQQPLNYNADDPEGQWLLLRDDVSVSDATDFVATQTRPPDDLLLGTPPPGPATFAGVRFFLECYANADKKTTIPGGTWDAQPIEIGVLPPLVPPLSSAQKLIIVGGEIITPVAGLEVVTLGGWREAVFSVRILNLVLAATSDRARVYVREF